MGDQRQQALMPTTAAAVIAHREPNNKGLVSGRITTIEQNVQTVMEVQTSRTWQR